jgi:hypothetical protein
VLRAGIGKANLSITWQEDVIHGLLDRLPDAAKSWLIPCLCLYAGSTGKPTAGYAVRGYAAMYLLNSLFSGTADIVVDA